MKMSEQKEITGATGNRMSGEERRRQLIKAATCLFAKNGFNGTTTKEIAAKADVNESLIFRHFEGKEDLFESVIKEHVEDNRSTALCSELVKAAELNDDAKVFETAGKLILNRYQSDREVFRVLMFGVLEQRPNILEILKEKMSSLSDFMVDYINRRIEDGNFSCERPDITVKGFIGMVSHQAKFGEIIGQGNYSDEDKTALKIFVDLILKGMEPEKNNQ